jgi:DNA polymerase-3 subunit alpha
MMGKKLMDKMRAEKDTFIAGCVNNPYFIDGCSQMAAPSVAAKIWDQIEASGEYAFGLAHAQGYSFTGAWSAYFKANYYREFITACLITDPKKVPQYLTDAKRHDLAVLPPDINASDSYFTLTDEGLRFGLSNVKYLGVVAQREILQARPFVGLEDFLEKIERRRCNNRIVSNLIRVGAFDSLGPRDVHLKKFYELTGQLDMELPDFSDPAVLRNIELELLGLYVSSTPLDPYREQLADCVTDTDDVNENGLCEVGGFIQRIKEIQDRRGRKMCFIDLAYDDIMINIIVFGDKYADIVHLLAVDVPVRCKVKKLKKGICLEHMTRLDY